MKILVIAEHDNLKFSPVTLNLISAARQLGDAVDVLVAGEGCRLVAQALSNKMGIDRLLLADHPAYGRFLVENISLLVAQVATEYTHVIAAASSMGKDLIPRVAALLGVAPLSDVMRIDAPDTFTRPIYAGNVLATVRSLDMKMLLTIRGSAFQPCDDSDDSVEITELDIFEQAGVSQFLGEERVMSSRPDLTSAKTVISGGRGLGSGEKFKILDGVADVLGAAVGASRAAVDAGFVSNELQVGQTGKVVAPHLYIAVGISGAIQHLAGMSGSKVIVAINKDEDAPIFSVADYGLVADLFDAIPALESELRVGLA